MEWYLAVLLFALSTTITPGPNNIMLMSAGVNFGFKQSLPHLLGIAIGFPLMVAAVGFGFSTIFTLIPNLHFVIQCIGIVYLLYLSWLIARSHSQNFNTTSTSKITFKKAALFQWVNPKAWVMAVGSIATYTASDANLSWQVIFIALSFFLVAIPCLSIWLMFGQLLSKCLSNPTYLRLFNYAMAILLVSSLIPSIQHVVESFI
ncbi:LysE family translocator [Vibrio sp.]|nr:LysE family translocator [Vibrio sp.]